MLVQAYHSVFRRLQVYTINPLHWPHMGLGDSYSQSASMLMIEFIKSRFGIVSKRP